MVVWWRCGVLVVVWSDGHEYEGCAETSTADPGYTMCRVVGGSLCGCSATSPRAEGYFRKCEVESQEEEQLPEGPRVPNTAYTECGNGTYYYYMEAAHTTTTTCMAIHEYACDGLVRRLCSQTTDELQAT